MFHAEPVISPPRIVVTPHTTGKHRMKSSKMHRAVIASLIACSTLRAGADIIGSQLGTGAPPTAVAGVPINPFPFRADIFAETMNVLDEFEREYRFNSSHSVRQVGFGWATWSHGYTGNVYYTNGATSIRITYPRGIKTAYLYVQPNPFGMWPFTIKASDGNQTITELGEVEGSAGASGWLFTTTLDSDIIFVEISSDVDFAVGEFGVSDYCPADLNFDHIVDFSDFLVFLTYFDSADARADYTQDGLVDFSDYLVFLDFFGNSCEN